MATITFYGNLTGAVANDDPGYINHSQSGIGFFGGDFGLSVPVDSYQDTTWITDSDGINPAEQLQNTKYSSISGVKFNTNNEKGNNTIPNYYAPLNIRFEHDEVVRVKNCQLRIFDRNDITKNASGVTTEVYEVRHPDSTEGANKALNHRGEAGLNGEHGWTRFMYDGVDNTVTPMSLTESPGVSGLNGNNDTDQAAYNAGTLDNTLPFTFQGDAHQSLRHDWYLALSASPDEIGSKVDFGLYFTVEYL